MVITAGQQDLISANVRSTGPVPPDGCRLLLLGRERAITVWDSADDRDRFLTERLAPAYQEAGLSLDDFERTHHFIHTGVPGAALGGERQQRHPRLLIE